MSHLFHTVIADDKNHPQETLCKKAEARHFKNDGLDLLGEGNIESFTGSHAYLESAADNLFTSLRPQPLVSHCVLKLQRNLSHQP